MGNFGFKFYAIALPVGERAHCFSLPAKFNCIKLAQPVPLTKVDGSEQEEVVHIVQFKIVTDESQDGAGKDIGNWKIIDIDDLLEGNMLI